MIGAAVILFFAARLNSPTQTVQMFFDALNKRDVAAAAKLIVGGEKAPASWPAGLPPFDIKCSNFSETITGASAVVRDTVELSNGGSSQPKSIADVVMLRQIDGAWRIVPDVSGKTTNDGLAGGFAAMLVDPDAMLHAFRQAKKTALALACLSNVKQLALGCLMYMSDNDDKLMPPHSDIHKLLAPYLKNRELWFCPLTHDVAYAVNANLLGRPASSIKDPSTTILLYEGKDGKFEFRHEGKASVAFADGHAILATKEEAAKMHWKP